MVIARVGRVTAALVAVVALLVVGAGPSTAIPPARAVTQPVVPAAPSIPVAAHATSPAVLAARPEALVVARLSAAFVAPRVTAPASAAVALASPSARVAVAAADDCHCTGDFVKDKLSAAAFVAPKPGDKDTGLDAKKKYRAEGNGPNLDIYTVDKNGQDEDLVLTIPGTNSYGFSPDSDRLVAFYGTATMDLYDLTSGSQQPIWTQDMSGAEYGFSGGGAHLIQRFPASAVVFDVATHAHVPVPNGSLTSAADVIGFAPGDKAMLIERADNSAALYSFPAGSLLWSQPTTPAASSYGFGPKGTYLVQRTVTTAGGTTDQQTMDLSVWHATTAGDGSRAYQADFTFGLPPAGKDGAEEVGFGPDGAVLLEAHANPNPTSGTLFVKNLANGKNIYTDGATPPGTAWAFSPCGDVWAVVGPNGSSLYNLRLLSTADGTTLVSSQIPAGTFTLKATVDSFTVTDSSGATTVLAPNPHGKSCTDTPAAAVTSLALKDSTVSSGGSTTGTVTLAAAATADTVVTLKADAGATVPVTVTVAAGKDSATFDVTAPVTASLATVTITASLPGSSQSATLTVNPAAISTLLLSPRPVVGGQPVTATITLNGIAPTGGSTVTLTSNAQMIIKPTTMKVPAGSDTVALALDTAAVDASTTVTLTATTGSAHASTSVEVQPIQLESVTIPDDPNPISSDVPFHVTVRLNGTADAAHIVTLRSSDTSALTVPDSVVVPAGTSSVEVLLTPVPQWRYDPDHPLAHPTWTVTVTAADATASAALDVGLVSPVMLNYARFEGGDNQVAHVGRPVDLEIALDRAWNVAVEGDSKTVALSTDQPNLVSLPLGPDGKPGFVITESSDDDLSDATWERYAEIRVRPVAQPTTATITVSVGGLGTELTLEIEPPYLGAIYTIAGTGMTDSDEKHLVPGTVAVDPLRADLCGCVGEVPSPVKDVVVAPDGTVFASYTGPDPDPDNEQTGIPSGIARVDASGLTRYADLTGLLDLADPDDPYIRSGQLDLGADGTLYVSTGHSVLAVATDGTVSTVPGSADLGEIADVSVGVDGALYLADWTHRRVWRLGPDGVPTVYVGTGDDGSSGDDGPATQAAIGRVYLDISPLGVLYLGDIDHHVLRAVAADGTISTIAGTGEAGVADDGDEAATALVDDPNPTATPGGGVLFSDEATVQFLAPNGTIERIAGGSRGFFGDGGRADWAELSTVGGVAVDGSGNVYIADAENARVREVAMASQLLEVSPVIVSGVADFGDVTIGTVSAPEHLTLTNSADWPVTVSGLDVVDQPVDGEPIDDFLFLVDGCTGSVLAPGATCTVDVALRPLGPHQRSGVLGVSVAGTGTQIENWYGLADLDGTGVTPLAADPSPVDFGSVALGSHSDPTTVTVTNGTGSAIAIDSASVDGPFVVGSSTCATVTLQPGGTCTVDITFSPTDGGLNDGDVHITGPSPLDGDGATPTYLSIPLTGIGCDSASSGAGTTPAGPSASSAPSPACEGGGTGPTDSGEPTQTERPTDTGEPTDSGEPTDAGESGDTGATTSPTASPTAGDPDTGSASTGSGTPSSPMTTSAPSDTSSSPDSSAAGPGGATAALAAVSPGDIQVVSADGFSPGEQVHAWLHSQPIDLGVVLADPHGRARLEFVVPQGLESGVHSVELVGGRSGHRALAQFSVIDTRPVIVTYQGSLPETGVPTASLLAAALLLVGLGGGLLLASRRRRRTH